MSIFKRTTILTALTCVAAIASNQTVHAADQALVIELFSYPSCIPISQEKEHYNPDGSMKQIVHKNENGNEHTHDLGPNYRLASSIFQDLTNENPDAIALNYFIEPPGNDQNGTTIKTGRKAKLYKNTLNRQVTYHRDNFILDDQITANMIINGKIKTEGTNKNVIEKGIIWSQKIQDPTQLKLAINGQNIHVELPQKQSSHRQKQAFNVTLTEYKKHVKEPNPLMLAFKAINIVQHIEPLDDWDGSPKTLSMPITDINADGFALLVNDKATGEIVAAGKIERSTKDL